MTNKQPEALRLAEHMEISVSHAAAVREKAAAELRRLHEVNAELAEIFKRIRFEQGFACECGIEDATWGLIESVIAKFTGK
jgi:hypothetical protein